MSNPSPAPKPVITFEEAIKPLAFLVKHELTIINLELGLQNESVIREFQVKEMASKASERVYNHLSEENKQVLANFFNESYIVEYIAEVITCQLVELAKITNYSSISKNYEILDTSKDMK